jgi:hypothetical protein
MVIAETGRIETFPEREFSSGDLALLGPLMKDFIESGLRGMLESTPAPARQRPGKGRRPVSG